MMTALKRFHACTATVCAPNPAAGRQQPKPFLESPGHSQASLLWGHRSFLLGPGAQGSVVPSKNLFPILCKFWQLYGGVNGDLLQEDLRRIHTQSPCPFGRPLPTRTSIGGAQRQFCLSLCGVPGSWCAQGLFEHSEHLWQEWGLLLNANSPLLALRSCKSHAVTIQLSSSFWLSLGYTKERIALVTNGSTVSHWPFQEFSGVDNALWVTCAILLLQRDVWSYLKCIASCHRSLVSK